MGVICAVGLSVGALAQTPAAAPPPAAPAVAPNPDEGLREELRRLTAAARDRVYPALVNIRVVTVEYIDGGEAKGGGTGSGTIISPQGHVVTNAHVVENGVKFTCTLSDQQSIPAELVGEDPMTDLAVLKLDLSKLKIPITVAAWGDASELQVGDTVLAMGSPFSLSRSVTLGIVSNTGRVFTRGFGDEELDEMELDSGRSTGTFTRWIQHDALINPGNSGGPLVNMRGQIVGVNALGGSGMGFAIPADLAQEVVRALVAHGEVPRSTIGVALKSLAKTGLTEGVLVNSVLKSGPAARAGVQAGDVIIAMGGEPITARFAEEIPPIMKRIADTAVGGSIPLTLRRGQETIEVSVTTERLPSDRGDETSLRGWGLSVAQISERDQRRMRLASRQGALITSVRSGGPSDLSEPALRRGDVILRVGTTEINDLADIVAAYREIMKPTKREEIPEHLLVEVWRENQSVVTVIKPRPEKAQDPPREVARAWLGVQTQPVFRELSRQIGIEGQAGFRVTRVYPGTTAASSDLKPGDVIVGVNDEKMSPRGVQDAGALQRRIRQMRSDATVTLKVLRGSTPVDVPVKLEAARTSPDEARTDFNRDFELRVRETTFFDRDKEGWPEDVPGVMVMSAEPMGWAGLAGIGPGDLIQKIDSTPITTIEDFRSAMERLAKEQPARVVFMTLRREQTQFRFAEPEWKAKTKEETRQQK